MTTSLNKCVNVLTYGFVQDGDSEKQTEDSEKNKNYFGKLPAINNIPDTVDQEDQTLGVGREPHPNDPVFYLEFTSSTDSAKNINREVVPSNLNDVKENCTLKIFQKDYGKLVGGTVDGDSSAENIWDGWKSGWRTGGTSSFDDNDVNGQIYKLLDAIVKELINPDVVPTDESSNVDTCKSRRIKNIYLRVNLI